MKHQAMLYYDLWEESPVSVYLSNVQGKRLHVLVEQAYQEKGKHEIDFRAENFPRGVYVVSLQTKDQIVSKKLILLE